jgi:hypothetical protein
MDEPRAENLFSCRQTITMRDVVEWCDNLCVVGIIDAALIFEPFPHRIRWIQEDGVGYPQID